MPEEETGLSYFNNHPQAVVRHSALPKTIKKKSLFRLPLWEEDFSRDRESTSLHSQASIKGQISVQTIQCLSESQNVLGYFKWLRHKNLLKGKQKGNHVLIYLFNAQSTAFGTVTAGTCVDKIH